MAVSTQTLEPTNQGTITNPSSFQGNWFELISVGGADDTDNSGSTITSPVAQITAATRIRTQIPIGTSLIVRQRYDDGDTSNDVAKGGLNRVDLLGCSEILCGVKTAYGVSSGNAALSAIEAKIL